VTVWRQLFTRRMLICVFTGFASGLPLYLLLTLVPAWLRTEHVDLRVIGLLTLIQFPYNGSFSGRRWWIGMPCPCWGGGAAGCC
jgi:PAT family beta-lactamase induction signal transducer AmpG